MSSLWTPSFPWPYFLLRGAIVYGVVLVLLRLGGKRQVGQMGAGEFVAILLISNSVQNAMNGGDNSILGGLLAAATIILLSVGVEYLTFKSKKLESLIQGRPRLLIHQGLLVSRNLEKELLNVHELKTLLRKQGVHNLAEIQEAILESDGSISVMKVSDTPVPVRKE